MMSENYKNILVAIDGSDASKKAFERAATLAKQHEAKLILCHVIDSRAFSIPQAYDKVLIEHEKAYVKEFMNEYIEKARDAGVTDYEKLIEYGSPRMRIANDIAKESKADVVVCGATGLNAIERFFIGSVSASIVRYAPCDVLVVR